MTEIQVIDICTFFSDEVHNGGFLQLLYNDSNAYTRYIEQCLIAIGADEIGDICKTALSVFPNTLPDDLEQRRHFLSEFITPDIIQHLDQCDKRFYERDDQFDACLGRFIDQHFPDDPIPVDRTKPKDYVALFCKLKERTASTWDDFADAKLRRRQNKAGKELHKLNMELFARPDKGAPVILKLLQSENPHVRVGAGAYCLMAQIHEDLGKSVLEQIAEDPASDRMVQFEAECCIKYCRPYKPL